MQTGNRITEKGQEIKAKAKSFRYWVRGLIDATLMGGFDSVAGGLGLAGMSSITASVDMPNWKTFLALFVGGAILRLAQFFNKNPLTNLD